jgi:hypothetical protein
MLQKRLWQCVLIFILCIAIATPAEAGIPSKSDIAWIVVGIVAGLVVITVVVVHEVRKGKTIAGCVKATEGGLTVTNEKDSQTYALTGSTAGLTAGERMRLKVRKAKSKDSKPPVLWVVKDVGRNLGVCQP